MNAFHQINRPSSRHACLWAALGLVAALAFLGHSTQAAVTEAWVHRYNSPANSDDTPTAVAVDGLGNVVVTGYSYSGSGFHADFYTAKYAAATGTSL